MKPVKIFVVLLICIIGSFVGIHALDGDVLVYFAGFVTATVASLIVYTEV